MLTGALLIYFCFYITLHWRGALYVCVFGGPKTFRSQLNKFFSTTEVSASMGNVISLRSLCVDVIVFGYASAKEILSVNVLFSCNAATAVVNVCRQFDCAERMFVFRLNYGAMIFIHERKLATMFSSSLLSFSQFVCRRN